MATTRGELKGRILRFLNKTGKHPGFYTPEKIDDAIEEAMDFVAVHMFQADEGWAKKVMFLDTEANQVSIDLPISAAMISEVRYRFGTEYIPLIYDTAQQQTQYAGDSGVTQWCYRYMIVDNAIYFNPIMAEGGEKYLMLTYQAYPKRVVSDADYIETQFENCFTHYIKYKACSILAGSIEKFARPWAQEEAQWEKKMIELVQQRNQQSQPIIEFCG